MKYYIVLQTVQKLEISVLAVISKIYSHISWSKENKTKLTASSVAIVLIKWKKKANPSLYNHVGNIEWCQVGKYHAETRDIDCLCCKDLVALDESSLKVNYFMLFSKIWKIDAIIWNFWDLSFRMIINFSDLTLIYHVLILL